MGYNPWDRKESDTAEQLSTRDTCNENKRIFTTESQKRSKQEENIKMLERRMRNQRVEGCETRLSLDRSTT